jgi:spore germination protein YaaH
LNRTHKLYRILGIKKPQIIGFQPFWLLKRADKPYQKYISTLTYFGLTLDSDGRTLRLVNPQEEDPGWTTLKSDRFQEKLNQAQKKRIKTSLLIHTSNEASISALLKKPEKHAQNLINDVNPIMQKYGFTDLNLDIESFKEASESAQRQYTAFVREVKKGMDKNSLGTLTVEITPSSLVKPRLTNALEIGKIADFVVLMAYDFHYIHSFLAGPVAPIGGVGKSREYDVETALKQTLKVIPAEKIILGIPLYGYEWETISNKPGAATIPGSGSTASNRRVTELLEDCDDCTRGFDEQSQQPYVVFPDGDYSHQIYYEDETSIRQKLALVKKYKINGVALWALGYEGKKILEPLRGYKILVDFNPSLSIID